ncbi:ribosomal-protein-alanine N-acetyltransferase [Edaphobacter aggregans]|uniref:Ribosomal-protein-alanine N-acetyltransferase n=1 Tax=Edaphobacter aggregans TaxID=570835 RepID=A0A428MGI1_9BACT|nr:GNAT family N-acetyltransferase [Edaphobacter aggregans]RSL15803.1 ribosomal-protein-alanine N-acetyltransferase [Edaphobacter aggregans]
MSSVRVRVAEVADLDAVVVLERSVAEAPHWGAAEYAAIVASGDGGVRRCLFVADVEGRVIGFAVGKVIGAGTEGSAELESVAVDVAARRMGVGRALCGSVVKWCREVGSVVVELEVRAASAGAIALYEGLGFVGVGRRRGYYRDPVDDALLMRLELGNCGEGALPSSTGVC